MSITDLKPVSFEIVAASHEEDILAISVLASKIWSDHYVPIIGQRQVDYMLEKFQSVAAISEQIESGFDYFQVRLDGRLAAYFALLSQSDHGAVQISKFYVRRDTRRRGLGRRMMMFIENHCIEQGMHIVWLTVNRHNSGSLRFYQQLGFKQGGSLIQEIGQGFVMDDYKMLKHIDPNPFD